MEWPQIYLFLYETCIHTYIIGGMSSWYVRTNLLDLLER